MKRVTAEIILPFIIALTITFYFSENKQFNDFLFPKKTLLSNQNQKSRYISNFVDNPNYESQFLQTSDSSKTIYLLGSSELTSPSPALPYNFISNHFATKVMGVGHAGNQSLSIYSQLLANENRLDNLPIVFIISPNWFDSRRSKGTSSAVFLEYNSENFLNKILKLNHNAEFQEFLYKRITNLFPEFNSPNLEIKLMIFKSLASRSFIHKALYTPVVFFDELLLSIKENINLEKNFNNADCELITHSSVSPDSVIISWDSLFSSSKQAVLSNATNNKMGISNDYYLEYINGKQGNIQQVDEKNLQELEDFKMLIKLLKQKKVNASFIISPLNPYYYKNLNDLLPVIQTIEKEILNCKFPCLNLFETDTLKYDKALLRDVMHLSDYGWHKVDQFIINTYHLNKWKEN